MPLSAAFAVLATLAATAGAPGAAYAETGGIQSGDRVVAARFHDRCDGGSEVQLLNPYQVELVFEVNGELVAVGPQQRPWHTVTAVRRRTVAIRIFDATVASGPDVLTHAWSPPSSCAGTGGAKLPGQSRLSAQDNGLPGGDSMIAARFRDGCAGHSDVQLPNPYSSDLAFDVNGDRVVVGPQQQPWHATTAVGGRRGRSIEILIERPTVKADSITHVWTPSATCTGSARRTD